MKEMIRQFIVDTLRRNNQRTEFKDDDSLIKSQRLDSLDTVDLLLFIEEKYNIPPSALGEDYSKIDTLNLIIDYIESKK
jgi:acyl carrier protein